MTIETEIEDMAEAEETTKEDLKEAWGCDSVEIGGGGNTIVLNWKSSVDDPSENVMTLSEELSKVAENNPNAQVQCFADTERFTVQVQVQD